MEKPSSSRTISEVLKDGMNDPNPSVAAAFERLDMMYGSHMPDHEREVMNRTENDPMDMEYAMRTLSLSTIMMATENPIAIAEIIRDLYYVLWFGLYRNYEASDSETKDVLSGNPEEDLKKILGLNS